MNKRIFNINASTPTLTAIVFFVVSLFLASTSFAETHNFNFSAKVLPNGQLGYALGSNEAVIPGPTIIVKKGDTINVALTNETNRKIGFKVPKLTNSAAAVAAADAKLAEAAENNKSALEEDEIDNPQKNQIDLVDPGQTKSYSISARESGTFAYHGGDKKLLGLFGAIVVNEEDKSGHIDKLMEGDGKVTKVKEKQIDKQIVLFMVGSTFWGQEIAKDGTQKPLWAGSKPGAVEDDIVRFHILAVGPGHTFHLHAHRWFKTGTDELIDTKIMRGISDGHSFTIRAGTNVGPGEWQFHCHLVVHMEAGMHGNFHVHKKGENGESVVGASPYGRILLGKQDVPGLVTFEMSDEGGKWMRSTRSEQIKKALPAANIKSDSLEVISPGSSVNFVMSDTNGKHTVTSLIWPSGSESHNLPLHESDAYRGGAYVVLDVPGLYVFTCKVHPFMFAAVIVDDPNTEGLDLGHAKTDFKVNLLSGAKDIPTNSDIALRLLKSFFIATAVDNWQDYKTGRYDVVFPDLPVRISGEPKSEKLTEGGFVVPLSALNTKGPLTTELLPLPEVPGVGEVWVNTQFEKTAGKYKPGTTTVIDASNWTVKRKVALPQINNNNPHNMWTNRDQSIVYQTMWFDRYISFIERETGKLLENIVIGYSPAHVQTLPTTDELHISINGENGMYVIPAGGNKPTKVTPTQAPGHLPANPHGHWIGFDGSVVASANIGTQDTGVYSPDGKIFARTKSADAEGRPVDGAHPIAIGMMPDNSKIFGSNLLHNSVDVMDGTGKWMKTVRMDSDYNPITGELTDNDGNGKLAMGLLPIQAPVSPDGNALVAAAMDGQIVVFDTRKEVVAASFPCFPGCHGVNFGAKLGGGYYAYVASKFANVLAVVDIDPNNDGDISDAKLAGHVPLWAPDDPNSYAIDDVITGLNGFGGQGVLPVPNVYNGWVQNLPQQWKDLLTAKQQNPVGTAE